MRKAKITATLGPSTHSYEIIKELCLKGVDFFRLNFSHGGYSEHQQGIEWIRKARAETGKPIEIIADLQGPKFRIGCFQESKVYLKKGDLFCLDQNPEKGDSLRVFFPHPEFFQFIAQGQCLLLNDGIIKLRVLSVAPTLIKTEVLQGGELSDCKGVNLPDDLVKISVPTEKDLQDIQFILEQKIEMLALSFIQSWQDIQCFRDKLPPHIFLWIKIEKSSVFKELETIVSMSDGIIVARGDLGVEMGLEKVPCLQKRIIRLCRQFQKPVMVATQMLESMVNNPIPTRAEVSDVANAIFEGADGVMLSAESAVGAYPCQAVGFMERIISCVEKDPEFKNRA